MANNIKIDYEVVEKLAARGLTREQVALSLGISSRTLERRKKTDSNIEEAYMRGKAKGVATISNALFDKAKEGNVTAQIFFLKCNGWKESSEVEVKNTSPVQLVIKNDLKD